MLRLALCIVMLVPGVAAAQPERYELGRRLKQFEKAWDVHTDAAARKRALEIMPQVTQQFFSFRFGDAGRTLDEARWRLEGTKPNDTQRWLASLYAVPEKRIMDTAEVSLKVTIKAFYKTVDSIPEGAAVRIGFPGSPRVTVPISKLPLTVEVPAPIQFKPGLPSHMDYFLQVNFMAGSWNEFQEIAISFIVELNERARHFDEIMKSLDHTNSIPRATLLYNLQLFNDLREITALETDIPIAAKNYLIELLKTCTLSSDDDQALIPIAIDNQGDNWCAIPLGGKKILPFRMYNPTNGIDPKRRPLVVALHGAGGSENLFYEGYGDGHVVKLCRERGWFLITPRSALGFAGGPPLDKIVDQLANHLPIDRERVFVVGHSMGAAQTIACCQQHRGLVAAAAALGGGGRVSKASAFADLPVFVGVGTKDFALGGARSLKKSIEDAENSKLVYKEYPDLEHLVIVREALPDAFKLFDQVSDEKLKNR